MAKELELLRRALDAWDDNEPNDFNDCMEEIRAFLAAEPEAEEPVGWISESGFLTLSDKAVFSATVYGEKFYGNNIPLYLHPPRTEPSRKPMTKDEIARGFYSGRWLYEDFEAGIRFAEMHHGITE